MADLIVVPKHRDLIFDVGLHCGEDTEFYLRKGFRVVAFEANPKLVASCSKKLRSYIDTNRLTIVEGAIVDPAELAPGQTTVDLYFNDTHAFRGTVKSDWAERNRKSFGASSKTLAVTTVDFAQALRDHGIPYYLKIDIEGSDMVCVRALRAFSERPDYVSIESDKVSLANINDELETLASLGYDKFMAVEQSQVSEKQVPPDPPREGRYVEHRFELGSSGLFGRELDGPWKSKRATAFRYRWIRLSYLIAGDDGWIWRWEFRGAHRLRTLICAALRYATGGTVPGWYDTHARRQDPRPSNVLSDEAAPADQ